MTNMVERKLRYVKNKRYTVAVQFLLSLIPKKLDKCLKMFAEYRLFLHISIDILGKNS